MRNRMRFTLIELLIVISIIVILAAMLLPALSRVRYKAQLIVCMNQLKEIGIGFTTIAADNDGSYYKRNAYEIGNARNYVPNLKSKYGNNNYDDRPAFRDTIAVDLWGCPLSGPIYGPRSGSSGPAEPSSLNLYEAKTKTVRGSYNVLAGARATKHDPERYRLSKPGSIMKYKDRNTGKILEFDVIASDYLYGEKAGTRYVMSSHPDSYNFLQNRINPQYVTSPKHYQKGGLIAGNMEYGTFDFNYVRTDGSAFTFRNTSRRDPLMRAIPMKPDYYRTSKDNFSLLPPIESF